MVIFDLQYKSDKPVEMKDYLGRKLKLVVPCGKCQRGKIVLCLWNVWKFDTEVKLFYYKWK